MIETLPQKLTTRLVAIAFADVADYSRHMAEDSVGTVREWARLREQVLLKLLEEVSGRAVSMAGDALLLEFASASDAVKWALSVQKEMRTKQAMLSYMQIRIGINIDDAVDDGNTLQSDGVVIASRIHQLAAKGEIATTQAVRDIVRERMQVSFQDLGVPSLKNVDRPVRVFSISENSRAPDLIRPHLSWSSRPTLAVLPFRELGGDQKNRYFSEGITEEIITGVSKSRAMFVVARNSTLQFADSSKSQKEIARDLGVKYLLSGSVSRQADRLRIHTELTDVDRSRSIWAERFDGRDTEIFEFQNEIVANIVSSLEPKILKAEALLLGARPTESLDAYDCVLRGLSEFYLVNEVAYNEAKNLLERAVKLDRGYAQAYAYLAWCLNFILAEGFSKDFLKDKQRAIDLATTAVKLDPEDAFCMSVRGHIMGLLEGRPFEAVEMLDEAVRLNENLPLAWALSATSYAYIGDGEEACDRMLNVWRLTPNDPLNFFFWTASGLSEFVAGRYDNAIAVLKKAHRIKPEFNACLRFLAASYALNEQPNEARKLARELLIHDPGFSISGFMAWYPLRKSEVRERFILGLSAAGLPN